MSESFHIDTVRFRGPLESLLDLIEERKLSISEISLSEVADAYLSHIEKLEALPLGETSQFILVASTLLLIKSRTLLPGLQLSEDERETVLELERRLARLHIIRRASRLLRKAWGASPYVFPRKSPARPAMVKPSEASLTNVRSAAERLLNLLPKPEQLLQAAVAPLLALEDVIVKLRERLTSALRITFRELTRSGDKHERIVHFLAMLELVRNGSASVTQEKLFEDITIEAESAGAPRYGT
jgi:segregation and condensation protein A